jgi:hypothetical protein
MQNVFSITDLEYVGNQTFPKSLQAGRGLAFQTDKKLLCLNSTIPFWEIIRGPLILVHMVRGTVTFVPEKIRQKIMMRHFCTCSFPAQLPVTGTVSACKPVYTRSGLFDTNGQNKIVVTGDA